MSLEYLKMIESEVGNCVTGSRIRKPVLPVSVEEELFEKSLGKLRKMQLVEVQWINCEEVLQSATGFSETDETDRR